MIECPECGYGWEEVEYEEEQQRRKAIQVDLPYIRQSNCCYCHYRIQAHTLTVKRHAQQTRKTLEKRVR